MPVRKGSDCIGDEMRRFTKGQMHSGEDGPVVKDRKQAVAVALSACGKSKYSEVLTSLGFSAETAKEVVSFFAEVDWQRQFETGKAGPENPANYKTGQKKAQSLEGPLSRTGVKGDNGRRRVNSQASEIAGPALPKGPANPQGGSSKDVQGMRQLG